MSACPGRYLSRRRPAEICLQSSYGFLLFFKCMLTLFLVNYTPLYSLQSIAKMNNRRLRHILLAFADLLLTQPRPIRSQSACLSLRPPVHQVVYQQAVSINTDVLYNTTFYPLPEAAITVTNAPTSYSGVTTLQWTSTILEDDTGSSNRVTYSSAALPSPTMAQDTFVLVAMRAQQHQKRQSGSYFVSSEGTITNDCTTAPIYTAKNGVLTATVKGVVYTYSTSTGVSFAPFVPALCRDRLRHLSQSARTLSCSGKITPSTTAKRVSAPCRMGRYMQFLHRTLNQQAASLSRCRSSMYLLARQSHWLRLPGRQARSEALGHR
jgi:hypothetical protein